MNRPHRRASVLPPGVRWTPTSLQVFARVDGRFRSKRYPLDTDEAVLVRARERLIAHAKFGTPREKTEAMLGQDAKRYLALVKAMPSFDDRRYDIGQWVAKLGRRVRASITSADMRRVLEEWRVSGLATGKGGLSNGSLNRRRTALMHLYTLLDGRAAANPVKDVEVYDESDSEQIRAVDPKALYRIIGRVARLRWKARRRTHQGTRRAPSKTRARLRLMLWTGWPQKQIMRLTAADIDWQDQTVWIRRRKKGKKRKGAKARRIPLLHEGAVRALKAFVAADAWGEFSTSGMHKSFRLALAAENASRARKKLPPIEARPYDLRHTFGTEAAKRLTDERALQELMLHSSPAQTRRYTEAATSDRLLKARASLAAGESRPAPLPNVATRTRSNKSRPKTRP